MEPFLNLLVAHHVITQRSDRERGHWYRNLLDDVRSPSHVHMARTPNGVIISLAKTRFDSVADSSASRFQALQRSDIRPLKRAGCV